MKPLTIEIHGVGAHNRGAELMAIAIAERMRTSFPGVRIVVPPNYGSFEQRARHGFLTTWEFPGRFRARTIARLLPKNILCVAGILNPNEVDMVLDSSGFAFSDQWGPGFARHLTRKMNRRGRRNQSLVLLPQAFGPFKNQEVARLTRQLMNRSELIYARDDRSLAELRALRNGPTIRKSPDFTIAMKPKADNSIKLPALFAAIIPNKRMLDKRNNADYYGFLQRAIVSLQARRLNPVFVLHDANEDREVIAHLENNGRSIPVFEHDDPRVLKWILGRAAFVIGSRFHALVGALSQGVPCVGAGWSHKYLELFTDFHCADFMISDLTDMSTLESLLTRLHTPETYCAMSNIILAAVARLREQNEAMWREIEALIAERFIKRAV
jgi:colanic acid/amylovoran biosynthesis protein